MSKKGADIKAIKEEKPQSKVMLSTDPDSVKTIKTPRPDTFGRKLYRLVATTVFLTVVTSAAIVLAYYLAHKGGPAHQAVQQIAATYMTKKELPKQLTLFSYLLIGVAFAHTFVSHVIGLILKTVTLRRGVDLSAPRAQTNELTGITARAAAAHLNSHEAFSGFAAGVLCATLSGVQPMTIATIALAFIGLRTIYYPLYWFGAAPIRSIVWVAAWFLTLSLYVTLVYPEILDTPVQQWISYFSALSTSTINSIKKEL